MKPWVTGLLALVALYITFIVALYLLGRREEARAVARLVPDCMVFFKRILVDRRVPATRKLPVLLLIGYLAMPLDLVPDVLPVVGQLDDAVLVALVLRWLVKGSERDVLREH